MNHLRTKHLLLALLILPLTFFSCKKDSEVPTPDPEMMTMTLTVENVLNAQPLVESGTFQGTGTSPVILPGQSVSIHFSAAKGEALSFVTMYGWSNDLFFAPENPGIAVYDTAGIPIQGDVSAQIKLWDNGTRINQAPGSGVVHPGTTDAQNITEVNGSDAQGNTYATASTLLNASLVYDGNSYFTLTLKNTSGGTANETPLSPGVWTVSYIVGGTLLNPAPLYSKGKPTANGLTSVAEMGDNSPLSTYATGITGIFTPLSPVFAVVYSDIPNPLFSEGEFDRDKGLEWLAKRGIADTISTQLHLAKGVKSVYILSQPATKVLLPMINGLPGGSVSQQISVTKGDRLAIATMYGFSNDWFFASSANGVDATIKGDISSSIGLYDDGTAINQFPGAGNAQFNLKGIPLFENKIITAVPNPNGFNTLPDLTKMIRVTLN
jgi:hypothetical protein